MSELKAITIYDAYWKANSVGVGTGIFVYPKSEADKVISDLEESHKKEVGQLLMEIAELKEKLKNSRNSRKYWMKEYLIEYKECRHNKYKRCLAMARLCRSCWAANIFIHEGSDRISMHYMKWEKRWLELAEKFKDKEAK